MLPFEDHPRQERRSFPIVMLTLLAINVALFVYMLGLTPPALDRFVRTFAVVPAEIVQGPSLADDPTQPYITLITALFIHGGIAHILGNMIFLWVFGDNVESALGHLTFLGLYLTAGVMASLVHVLFFPGSTAPLVGASGAIAGVLAAYLLLYPQAQVRVLLFFGPFFAVGRVAALVIIFGWFVLQVLRGVGFLGPDVAGGGIAYLAHIGGFVTGLAITAAVRGVRHESYGQFEGRFRWSWTFRNWLITVVGLGATLALGAYLGGPLGVTLQGIAVAVAAGLALIDGVLRVLGRHAFLGEGRGIGRIVAVLQVLAAGVILMAALL